MSEHDLIHDFLLGQERAFVIPAEALGSEGMSPSFRAAVCDVRNVSTDWLDMFDAAFAAYWARATDLATRSPRFWLPPRVQNVLIAGPDEPAPPFSQPFYRASWTMYASDFDPESSNTEFAAYLFLHQERMAQTQQILSAFVQNLSYWLTRSDRDVALFRAGATRSGRPDAATFVALADAMDVIRKLYDLDLRRPAAKGGKPLLGIPPTGLAATHSQIEKLQSMGQRIGAAAEGAIAAFGKRYVAGAAGGFDALRRWLEEARPNVLVVGRPNEILWAPTGDGDEAAFREIAGSISEPVAEGLMADLRVVGACTSRFLASLRRPDELPAAHDEMEQRGLSYIHVKRNLVAYSLTDSEGRRLSAPSPTYDRLMLAARTIHEWGHQAVDGGWVPVSSERRDAFASLNAELAVLFEEIVNHAPSAVMAGARADLGALSQATGAIGRALADYAQSRMPDFQANLLSQRYLTRSQAEAYVRNNVYCLNGVMPPAQVFRQLARYAYEYQYLRFSDMADRYGYFRTTTWFDRRFIASGVVTASRVESLFALMSAICDCYHVDEAAFDFGEAAPGSPP
ncbi:MAG: hypothetical protein KDA33_12250 [Phycisphaerales bacterium]|nr:hypothetical protein [Phycisphaerales bacterium]